MLSRKLLYTLTALVVLASCKKDNISTPVDNVPLHHTLQSMMKELSTVSSYMVPEGAFIRGVVISDKNNKNTEPNKLILQEQLREGGMVQKWAGVVLIFEAAHAFDLGSVINVDISGMTIEKDSKGALTIKNIPLNRALSARETDKEFTYDISIKNLQDSIAHFANTLISLPQGTFTGGSGTLTGTLTYRDSSGSLPLVIMPGASFENKVYIQDISGVKGILRVVNGTPQLFIRNYADIDQFAPANRFVTDNLDSWDFGTSGWGKGFVTGVASYSTPEKSFYLQGGSYEDAAFTNPSRPYIYYTSTDLGYYGTTGLSATPFETLKNFREVKVTVAGSKIMTTVMGSSYDEGWSPVTFNPFLADNYFEVAAFISFMYKDIPLLTQQGTEEYRFTEAGVFHTVTFRMPSKAELLETIPLEELNDYYEQLKNGGGRLVIQNKSSERQMSDKYDAEKNNPLIISQLVYGFQD